MGDPARRTRAEAAEVTAARLIEVARKSFTENGFVATSLDTLAAQAGLTRGALHHHFGNKTGLFEAVLRAIDTEIEATLEQERAGIADPWDAFRRCFIRYLDLALDPSRRRILFEEAHAVLGARADEILMDDWVAEGVADLKRLMAEGRIAPVDPEALAHILNGAVMNLAYWAAQATPDEDRLTPARATLDRLMAGLTRP
ncbi:MAG: TetR family transcriptional regulator [Rhodobacteraceae bacterium]|nr:TetR family transcriptional regulator [Paracoccaceae bacterium]